jgi:hypothetical protein
MMLSVEPWTLGLSQEERETGISFFPPRRRGRQTLLFSLREEKMGHAAATAHAYNVTRRNATGSGFYEFEEVLQ